MSKSWVPCPSVVKPAILAIGVMCCVLFPALSIAQDSQPNEFAPQPDIEAADCPPFATFPQLPMTVVTSCHKESSQKVTLPLAPDAQGAPRDTVVEGASEFREYRRPMKDQQELMFDNLMQLAPMAGFVVVYSGRPSVITARSGLTWVLINVSDESYNLTVVRDSRTSCEPVHNAEEISREMDSAHRVPLYGIQFTAENRIVEDKSSAVLTALLKYISQDPSRLLVIESHKVTENGKEEDDLEITRERANAVVDWLVAHGAPAQSLQAKPFGRMQPIAGNDTATTADCNERIQLSVPVKKTE